MASTIVFRFFRDKLSDDSLAFMNSTTLTFSLLRLVFLQAELVLLVSLFSVLVEETAAAAISWSMLFDLDDLTSMLLGLLVVVVLAETGVMELIRLDVVLTGFCWWLKWFNCFTMLVSIWLMCLILLDFIGCCCCCCCCCCC